MYPLKCGENKWQRKARRCPTFGRTTSEEGARGNSNVPLLASRRLRRLELRKALWRLRKAGVEGENGA